MIQRRLDDPRRHVVIGRDARRIVGVTFVKQRGDALAQRLEKRARGGVADLAAEYGVGGAQPRGAGAKNNNYGGEGAEGGVVHEEIKRGSGSMRAPPGPFQVRCTLPPDDAGGINRVPTDETRSAILREVH